MHQQDPKMGKSRRLYSDLELHGGVGNLLIYKRTLVRTQWYEKPCPAIYSKRCWPGELQEDNPMRRSSRNVPFLRRTPVILRRGQGRSPDLHTGPLRRKRVKCQLSQTPPLSLWCTPLIASKPQWKVRLRLFKYLLLWLGFIWDWS